MTRSKSIIVLLVIFLSFISPAQLMAEKSGKIIDWGSQVVGVDLSSGYEAIAAGGFHSLGLKSDGSIVGMSCITKKENYDQKHIFSC